MHGFIHSKRRNRLKASTVSQLVFIYSNMGDKDVVDNMLYELHPEIEGNISENEEEEASDSDDEE